MDTNLPLAPVLEVSTWAVEWICRIAWMLEALSRLGCSVLSIASEARESSFAATKQVPRDDICLCIGVRGSLISLPMLSAKQTNQAARIRLCCERFSVPVRETASLHQNLQRAGEKNEKLRCMPEIQLPGCSWARSFGILSDVPIHFGLVPHLPSLCGFLFRLLKGGEEAAQPPIQAAGPRPSAAFRVSGFGLPRRAKDFLGGGPFVRWRLSENPSFCIFEAPMAHLSLGHTQKTESTTLQCFVQLRHTSIVRAL